MGREIDVLELIKGGSHTPYISQKGEVVRTEEEETIGEKPQNSEQLCLPHTLLFDEIHPVNKPCVILQDLPLQRAVSWTIFYLDLLQ